MSYQYDYAAESNGHVIGLRRGYEQGFKAGEVKGWNKALAQWETEVKTQWEPLVDRLTAERNEAVLAHNELLEQLRAAGQKNKNWHYAFNSLVCALDSAMEVLEHAPQEMRTRMMIDFTERATYMHSKGYITSMPQQNALVRANAPKTADKLRGWWDQAVAFAKKTTDRDKNPAP